MRDRWLVVSEAAALDGSLRDKVERYIVACIRATEPTMEFHRRSAAIRELNETLWLSALLQAKYDGLFLMFCDSIIAHLFFQYHEGWIHVFHVFTAEAFRGCGVSSQVIEQLLTRFNKAARFEGVQIGNGRSDELVPVLEAVRLKLPHGVRADPHDLGRFYLQGAVS